MGLFDRLTKTIGIDPGTQHFRLVHDGELIFNAPSRLSVHESTGQLTGIGNEVQEESPNKLIKPINTVIADFHHFEFLLRSAVKAGVKEKKWSLSAYAFYFAIPNNATEVDIRAYRDSAEHAGAKEVVMIPQPYATAIGSKLLQDKQHFILIDFSASKFEVTVFADAKIINHGSIPFGTLKLTKVLRSHLSRNYAIKISEDQSNSLLMDLPTLGETYQHGAQSIPTAELLAILQPYLQVFTDQFLETLEETSTHPNITKIISNGCFMTGGGTAIAWIAEQLKKSYKINTVSSKTPLLDNINGLEEIIKNAKQYQPYLLS